MTTHDPTAAQGQHPSSLMDHPSLDLRLPNPARIHNYLLGGKESFALDRETGDRLLRVLPDLLDATRHNHAFRARAFRAVAEQGCGQFLDIGCGFASSANVHQVVQAVTPGARTVYVDNDLVVATHARALLATDDRTRFAFGDLNDVPALLAAKEVTNAIDFDEPVGVGLLAVLHFLPTYQAVSAVAALEERLAPGSKLIFSQLCSDDLDDNVVNAVTRIFEPATAQLHVRSSDEIAQLLGPRWILQPPGLRPVQGDDHMR